jgi:hypothetical protein
VELHSIWSFVSDFLDLKLSFGDSSVLHVPIIYFPWCIILPVLIYTNLFIFDGQVKIYYEQNIVVCMFWYMHAFELCLG